MNTTLLTHPDLEDRPLSDRVILAVLAANGPLTYSEITDRTGISRSTVKKTVVGLREDDLVESTPDPRTPRANLNHYTGP